MRGSGVAGGTAAFLGGRWLFDPDDHLALGAPGLDIGQRLIGCLEREHPVDHWPDDVMLDERGDLAQLCAIRSREQERVLPPEALGLPSDRGAQQAHQPAQGEGETLLPGKFRIRWTGNRNRQPTRPHDTQRSFECLVVLAVHDEVIVRENVLEVFLPVVDDDGGTAGNAGCDSCCRRCANARTAYPATDEERDDGAWRNLAMIDAVC